MADPTLPLRGIHLSLIVPMYNEERRIRRPLAETAEFLRTAPFSSEIIVVDDGSTDKTGDVATATLFQIRGGNLLRYTIETHDRNRGKGAAIRTGLARSRGEWSLASDADGSTPIREVLKLLEAARESGAHLVAGSRACRGARVRALPHRVLIGRVFQWIAGRHGFSGLSDTQCGFKLYSSRLATLLARESQENGYIADIEHIALAQLHGLTVREVGVTWTHRSGGKVRLLRDSVQMWRDLKTLQRRLQRLRIAEEPRARIIVGQNCPP